MLPEQSQDLSQNTNPTGTPDGGGQPQQVPLVPNKPIRKGVGTIPQGIPPVNTGQQSIPPAQTQQSTISTIPVPNQDYLGQSVPSPGSNKIIIIIIAIIAVLMIGGYIATRLIMGGISTGLKSGVGLLGSLGAGDIDIKKEKEAVKIKAEEFFVNWKNKDAESIYNSLNAESKRRTSVEDINNFFKVGGVELLDHKIGPPTLSKSLTDAIPGVEEIERNIATFQTSVTQMGPLFADKKTVWEGRELLFTFNSTKEKDGILSGEWQLELSLIPYKTFLVGKKVSYQNLDGAVSDNRGTVSRDIKVGAIYRKNIVLSYIDKFVVDLPSNDSFSKSFYFYHISGSVITDDYDNEYRRIDSSKVWEFDSDEGLEKIHSVEYAVEKFTWPEKTDKLVSTFDMSVLNVESGSKQAVISVK